MILVIAEAVGEKVAMGGQLRRQSIAKHFASQMQVEELYVAPMQGAQSELSKFTGTTLSNDDLDLISKADVIIICGLPLALGLSSIMSAESRSKTAVDVCDSWLLLADLVGPRWPSGTRRLLKVLKMARSRRALARAARLFQTFIYISERDQESDLVCLQNAESFVLPNLLTIDLPYASVGSIDGPVSIVGDWSYPPNQEMLNNACDWIDQVQGTITLDVYGPNLRSAPSSPRVNVVGWVDSIADAYAGKVATLALLTSGAGVKNKVLESLANGVPVIASPEAREGISASQGLIPAESLTPDEALAEARRLLRSGIQPMAFSNDEAVPLAIINRIMRCGK